jgi:prepilin-type N-terminal cleavage/methylation domain-containing protein
MKNKSRKYEGFTLVEVVISMAIIAILSIAVYNGYLIIIKHTKSGQVKQMAALEGKKIIEQLQGSNFSIPNEDEPLKINDDIELKKDQNSTYRYERYLDGNYNSKDSDGKDIGEGARKYTELVTISPTTAGTDGDKVTFNDDGKDDNGADKCTVYIGKNSSGEYITDNPNNESTKLTSQNEGNLNKTIISLYIDKKASENEETIAIKDYKGENLLSMTKEVSNSTLYINLGGYGEADNDVIQINIYNKTTLAQNMCVEKTNNLNVNVQAYEGEINLYDNRASNTEEGKIGALYDLKVEIRDYAKDIEEDKNTDDLFTGYSKKNIG